MPRPPIMKFFSFGHLPDGLQNTSAQFAKLAEWVVENTAPGAEQSVCLRKLLEAKDAGVRAYIDKLHEHDESAG